MIVVISACSCLVVILSKDISKFALLALCMWNILLRDFMQHFSVQIVQGGYARHWSSSC